MERLDGHYKTKCVQSNLSHADQEGASVLAEEKSFLKYMVLRSQKQCEEGS